jgi:Domain of unknown function (DUF4259)
MLEVIVGAWGSGPFENDDAADWAYELEEAGDHGILRTALDRAVRDGGDLASEHGAVAVAAAAVVATAIDGDAEGLSDEVVAYIARAGRPDDSVIALARQALDAVAGGGELAELWDEADAAEWRASLASLRDRLATGQTSAG